jgi:hypothetical protein
MTKFFLFKFRLLFSTSAQHFFREMTIKVSDFVIKGQYHPIFILWYFLDRPHMDPFHSCLNIFLNLVSNLLR